MRLSIPTKRVQLILVFFMFLAMPTESRGQKQADNDDIIKIDVTKDFEKKRELILQDFMDVEYISLETKDGFYNQGSVQAIGRDIILLTNRATDGNIFVYD